MTDFRQYLASPATAERPSAGELDALAARYEWFAPVRIAREIVTGICDPRLAVTAPWRAQSSLLRRPIDAEAVRRLSSDDIIDRFLQEDDLRIVAADGEPEEEVRTAAELDDDDEVVSEELASMEVGDTALTTSGFYGVIIDITDEDVIVEFGNNKNCRIPMQKAAIAQIEKPNAD